MFSCPVITLFDPFLSHRRFLPSISVVLGDVGFMTIDVLLLVVTVSWFVN